MAKVLLPTTEPYEHTPPMSELHLGPDSLLTLDMLSTIVGGKPDIYVVGTMAVGFNPDAYEMKFPYNDTAARETGLHLHGPVLWGHPHELGITDMLKHTDNLIISLRTYEILTMIDMLDGSPNMQKMAFDAALGHEIMATHFLNIVDVERTWRDVKEALSLVRQVRQQIAKESDVAQVAIVGINLEGAGNAGNSQPDS